MLSAQIWNLSVEGSWKSASGTHLKPAAAMAAPGGEDSAPPPPISDSVAFRKLVASGGKRKLSVPVPKFIKKLDEIPEITLPETQLVKIALALSERGLVG